MTINPSAITHWLIRADQPFRTAQSYILPNGTVAFTNGLTPSQYSEERGFPVRVITDAELTMLNDARMESLISEPVEESEQEYWYALEVMPPAKWGRINGVEMFHISERIEGDIVAWHAQIGTRYFACNDRASTDRAKLAARFAAAAKAEV